MRVTQVLSKRHVGRWFNQLWKEKKRVTVNDHKIRDVLEAQGKEVVDAVKFFGFDREENIDRYARRVVSEPSLVDPLPPDPRHDVPAYTYFGHGLMLGRRQAQAITNTLQVGDGLPERIVTLDGLERLKNQDELVTDVIRSALMYDATQEKLPKVIDITRLGLKQPREYGIPEMRSNRALFSSLLSLCDRTSQGLAGVQSRMTLYKPCMQATNVTPEGHRLLLKRRPALALLSDSPLPPVAPSDAVEATRDSPPPDLQPVSPYVHLHQKHAYDWRDLPPVGPGSRHRHIHTLFLDWNGRLKHRMDDELLETVSLMCLYTAGLLMARQQTSPEPVTVQSVASDGQLFKFSVLQLNTMEMPEPGADGASTRHSVKNLFWTEPATPLYDTVGFRGGRPVLEGYNADVFSRFLAMYTNGLLARTYGESV